jgi:DNA-directed RNA polymerase subunit RPC12/RpoP
MKKYILFSITLFIILAAISLPAAADADSPKKKRVAILNEMKKNTDIEQDGQVYRTEHFNVYTDYKSLDLYGIENNKRAQALMLRICYILEEAHKILIAMTNEETFSNFTVTIYAPEIFMKEYQRSDPYDYYFTGSGIWVCVPKEAMTDPLGDFGNNIGNFYEIYTIMFCYSRWGMDMIRTDALEFSNYFGQIGQQTSGWSNTLSKQEKEDIIKEIDTDYTFLFKKYPDIFMYKDVNRKYMRCKWCKKEIDITGMRKNTRIKCPYCHKTITVK